MIIVLCFLFLSFLRPLRSHSPTKDTGYVPEIPSQIGIVYTYLNKYVYKKGPNWKQTPTHWNAMSSSMIAPLSVLSPNSFLHQILILFTLLKRLVSEIVYVEESMLFPAAFNNPYPTAFPYGNGMVLHFYQQQESSTTKTVHKVINKGLKAYV